MDGAVPIIYIGLIAGVILSFCLSMIQVWLAWGKKDAGIKENKKLIIAKRNLTCVIILFAATIYLNGTIIGYGPLIYIVPIQTTIVLFVYLKIRSKRQSTHV